MTPPSEKEQVVLWGDSLTEGRPGASFVQHLEPLVPELQLLNRGRSGDTVSSLLNRLKQEPIPADRYRLGLLWIGVNDAGSDLYPGQEWLKTARRQTPSSEKSAFIDTYKKILEKLHDHAENIVVLPPLFIGENPGSAPNTRLQSLVSLIEELASRESNTQFFDLRRYFPLDQNPSTRFAPGNPLMTMVDSLAGTHERYYSRASERRQLRWTYDGIHLNQRAAQKVARILAKRILQEIAQPPNQ